MSISIASALYGSRVFVNLPCASSLYGPLYFNFFVPYLILPLVSDLRLFKTFVTASLYKGVKTFS